MSALKRPETRGSWGEIQLRRVVELAGMVAHCDFTEQSTIHTDDGRLRPDLLVRLPGDKVIVVDSKVPLDAYLAAIEAPARRIAPQRELDLERHARQTRDHITKLASKGYQRQFDSTPELVVMFVPSDGIYQAALAEDPALIEYGVSQQVLMATPTTLIGLLRAVHYGWSQEQIAESAREIAESARELHRRLGPFAEHLAKTGRQLDSAVSAYNQAVGSFDHKLVPQIRSIEQAGVVLRAPDRRAPGDRDHRAPSHRAAGARGGRSALALGPTDKRSRGPIAPADSRPRQTPRGGRSDTSSVSATGTVAGSSSTKKNSRSKPSASAAASAAPRSCQRRPIAWPAARRARRRRTGRRSPSRPSRTPRSAAAADPRPDGRRSARCSASAADPRPPARCRPPPSPRSRPPASAAA